MKTRMVGLRTFVTAPGWRVECGRERSRPGEPSVLARSKAAIRAVDLMDGGAAAFWVESNGRQAVCERGYVVFVSRTEKPALLYRRKFDCV